MAEILGLKELEKRLKALPKKISGKNGGPVARSLKKAGIVIKVGFQKTVPVRTGSVRDSVKVVRDPNPIGANEIYYVRPFSSRGKTANKISKFTKKLSIFYWRFLEFGSIRHKPGRYLTKAAYNNAKLAFKVFRVELAQDIKQITKKLNK